MRRAVDPGLPTVLFVLHSGGGGTVRYGKAVAARLAGAANVIYAIGLNEGIMVLCRNPDRKESGIAFAIPKRIPSLISACKRLGVRRLNILHASGFEHALGQVLDAWPIPFDLTLTDYHLAADHPHLLDKDGTYATEPWRTMRRDRPEFVERAERIAACSAHLAGALGRFWPDLKIIAAGPVEEHRTPKGVAWRPIGPRGVLRVLLVTSSAASKGGLVWREVAEEASRSNLPIAFHLVTRPGGRRVPDLPNIIRHDVAKPNAAAAVRAVVREARPHLAWFPFQAPETYSFVVSDALACRLPILASAIGAVPERLSGRRLTWLVRHDLTPQAWLDLLVKLRRTRLLLPSTRSSPASTRSTEAYFPDAYMKPLAGPSQEPSR